MRGAKKEKKKKSTKQRFKIKRRKESNQIKQYLTISNLTLKIKNNINHILKKRLESLVTITPKTTPHTHNVRMHGGR